MGPTPELYGSNMLRLSCSGGGQQDMYRPVGGKQSITTVVSSRAGLMDPDLPISRLLMMYIKVRSRVGENEK